MNTFRKLAHPSLNKHAAFTNLLRGAHCTARSIIGNREVVGFGVNGRPEYADRPDNPFPALRWKETTPDICALREKEKCDWRDLSVEDKKSLYRASFRQTFAEYNAPTGEWKSIIGFGLMWVSFGIWLFYGYKHFVYRGKLPESFSDEWQQAQLRRIIDIENGPVRGIASMWDYDNCTWKNKP